jgi:transitional endoplasmic reticulum ATPase
MRITTLWTCNELDEFDPAMLRRMSMAIEVKTPPIFVRERVWRRNLELCGVALSEHEVRAIARDLDAPPALAATAAKTARLAGGGVDRIRMVVCELTKAMVKPSRACA